MHRSRLGGFIIDCNSDDLDAAARFCVVPAQRADFDAKANTWND
jgi:hypothetical protein